MDTLCSLLITFLIVNQILNSEALFFHKSIKQTTTSSLNCTNVKVCSGQFKRDPYFISDDEFARLPCFCDDGCPIYGDCCPDAPLAYFPATDVSSFSCLPNRETQRYIYVKTKCNKFWNSDKLRKLCENISLYDPLSRLYVTNYQQNITYRSIYCAVCNGESFPNLTPWEMYLKYPFTLNSTFIQSTSQLIKYLYNRLETDYELDESIFHLNGFVKINGNSPTGVQPHTRPCKPHIDTCPVKWDNLSTRTQCVNHTYYVYNNELNQTFKNFHCALCNLGNLDKTECLENMEPNKLLATLVVKQEDIIAYSEEPLEATTLPISPTVPKPPTDEDTKNNEIPSELFQIE